MFTRRHTQLTIEDGGTLSMRVPAGEGDFTVDNLQEGNAEALRLLARGVYLTHVKGDDVEQAGSFNIYLPAEAMTSTVRTQIMDAVRKTGAWAAAVSLNPGNQDVWLCRLIIRWDDGHGNIASVTLPKCRLNVSLTEGSPTWTMQVSFTNNGAPIFT